MDSLVGKKFNIIDKCWFYLEETTEVLYALEDGSKQIMGGDRRIVLAARNSRASTTKSHDDDMRLLRSLIKRNHESPLEMGTVKLKMHLPVLIIWQLVRHRIASLQMSSGRHNEFSEEDFYMPDKWFLQETKHRVSKNPAHTKIYLSRIKARLRENYERAFDDYQWALEEGLAREQARLFLPGWSLYYTFTWFINIRSLMNFLEQRCDSHAQYEIRELAKAIRDKILKPCFPEVLKAWIEYQDDLGINDVSETHSEITKF